MSIRLENIIRLTYHNEGVDVEFKETTGQLNRGMETLCGMINGIGGYVIFGVSNTGKLIGQEVSDKTTRAIGEALAKFDPAVDIQPEYIPIPDSNKSLIVFCSDGMDSDKPYIWNGTAYQRHDSVTTIMPRERFLKIHEQQHGLHYNWEDNENPNVSLSSLDEVLIGNVIKGAIRRGRLSEYAQNDDITKVMTRLQLMHNGAFRNSAAILFGKDLPDYPQAMVRLARFRGTDKREFIDNQQAFGNIFELVSESMKFIFKHLSLSGSTHDRIERKDELEIPYDAIREAIVNALCHRAWQNESSTIGIAIYDNRVEIENAGRFPASVSPAHLVQEESSEDDDTSLPPNRVIARIMFLAGYIEHWGRGLSMMKKECERVGLPQPIITDNGFMVKVKFQRPLDVKRTSAEHQSNTSRSTVEEQQNNSRNTVEEQLASVSPSLKRLIEAIGNDWLTGQALRNKMGYKSKGTFWANYLSPAIEKGLIALENEESPKSPTQRYGLTEKGRQILEG